MRDGECVAIGGRGCHREIISTRRSRDQEIAPTAVRDGECVAIGGRGCHREIISTRRSRDQEIAPTQLKKTKRWSFPHRFVG